MQNMYQKVGTHPFIHRYFLVPGALLLDHVAYSRRDQDLALKAACAFRGSLNNGRAGISPALISSSHLLSKSADCETVSGACAVVDLRTQPLEYRTARSLRRQDWLLVARISVHISRVSSTNNHGKESVNHYIVQPSTRMIVIHLLLDTHTAKGPGIYWGVLRHVESLNPSRAIVTRVGRPAPWNM
jgi:hypothetical protein